MVKINCPGDIHFVNFCTFQNKLVFKNKKCCQIFLDNLNFYRNKYDLKIYGYCLMPNHVHLLIYLDYNKFPDLTISKVIQSIKSHSAREIIDYHKNLGSREPQLSVEINIEQGLYATRKGHQMGLKYVVWQKGFYDFNIFTKKKFQEKLEYIHQNPTKSGLIDTIADYPYCSWINYNLNNNSIFTIDYPQF